MKFLVHLRSIFFLFFLLALGACTQPIGDDFGQHQFDSGVPFGGSDHFQEL